MSTRLNRVIVSVTDLGQSLSFYEDLLELPCANRGNGVAMLTIGDRLELLLHQRKSVASDLAVAASFTVAALDELCARWEKAGGTVVDQPAAQPWGDRMGVVRDPDGHLVCLVQA